MKKFFIFIAQLIFIFSLATAAKKTTRNSPVVLDWQYRDEGEEIPAWVFAIDESDKETVMKELELDGCKMWTVSVSGESLEVLEMDDGVAYVAAEISKEISIKVNEMSISEKSSDVKNTQASIMKIQEAISESEIRGLQKVTSFWIKNGVAKKGVKKAKKESDYQVKFNYYSVWVMDKDLYEIQLKKIIERF